MNTAMPAPAVHPNVDFVNEAHNRLEAGDLDAINEMFADDIVWHEFGDESAGLGGDYRGRDAVMAFWKVYFRAAGPTFSQDIVAITANDEYVSSIVVLSGSKPDRELRQSAIDIMRMHGGKIAEFWRYYEDLADAATFFGTAHDA